MKNNKKLQKGFSLVEMLVAIAVFMSVMTVAVSALMTIIDTNRKAQAIKTTTDNVTFAIENISRDMRMGYNYECLSPTDNTTFTNVCSTGGNVPGSSAVSYTNFSGDNVTYRFNAPSANTKGSLTRTICPKGSNQNCSTEDLISSASDVKISNVTFYVIGAENEFATNISDKTQPRVVITVSGTVSSKGSADTLFNLQTNISQRTRR